MKPKESPKPESSLEEPPKELAPDVVALHDACRGIDVYFQSKTLSVLNLQYLAEQSFKNPYFNMSLNPCLLFNGESLSLSAVQ